MFASLESFASVFGQKRNRLKEKGRNERLGKSIRPHHLSTNRHCCRMQRNREIDKCLVAVSRHMLCINYSKTNGVPLFVHRLAFFFVIVSSFCFVRPIGSLWLHLMPGNATKNEQKKKKIVKFIDCTVEWKTKTGAPFFFFFCVPTLAIFALIIHITSTQLMCALI